MVMRPVGKLTRWEIDSVSVFASFWAIAGSFFVGFQMRIGPRGIGREAPMEISVFSSSDEENVQPRGSFRPAVSWKKQD